MEQNIPNFFAEKGMTSTSANHLANIAKEVIRDKETELAAIRFYSESVELINSEKKLLKEGYNKPERIGQLIEEIAAMYSFSAWAREAIKRKDEMLNELEAMDNVKYCHRMGIELPTHPISYPEPTEQDVLDEMNMSYVERYFADFLSAMESKEKIALWNNNEAKDDSDEVDGVPQKVALSKNLFIIGTINVDETTYMFSPKVLDRANVIEFKISSTEMGAFLQEIREIDRDSIISKAAGMGADFVAKACKKDLAHDDEAVKMLQKFFDELKNVNAEFGYRSATEIFRFICQAKANDDTGEKMTDEEILDAAIVQKLLPKLHGSRKKLEPVLAQLWKLCFTGAGKDLNIAKENVEKAQYKESADKIRRMYESATANGFTSFAEA